jgi:hypothetical protein
LVFHCNHQRLSLIADNYCPTFVLTHNKLHSFAILNMLYRIYSIFFRSFYRFQFHFAKSMGLQLQMAMSLPRSNPVLNLNSLNDIGKISTTKHNYFALQAMQNQLYI